MEYFGKWSFFILLFEYLTINFMKLSHRDLVPELMPLSFHGSHSLSIVPASVLGTFALGQTNMLAVAHMLPAFFVS